MKHPTKFQKAFSLIEVTIALGILSFALVPMIGLLSIGLQNSRASLDRSIETQIIDWSYGKAKAAAAVNNLAALLAQGPFYFDGDGQPLAANADSNLRLFSAELTSASIPLPGSNESIPSVRVTIKSPVKNNQLIASHAFWLEK